MKDFLCTTCLKEKKKDKFCSFPTGTHSVTCSSLHLCVRPSLFNLVTFRVPTILTSSIVNLLFSHLFYLVLFIMLISSLVNPYFCISICREKQHVDSFCNGKVKHSNFMKHTIKTRVLLCTQYVCYFNNITKFILVVTS